ncbi:hypothetical protein [Micromonospora sonchi]|uniref:hypothetical protein n=1 Tax=Micromonospora sonchi TaxID=1763543 RepID=UPI001669A6B3|nr:hypothetical protein [Micromonospora sonchi]
MLDVARVALPYASPVFTVAVVDGAIRLDGIALPATDALDLSIALLAATDLCRWHRLPYTSRAGHTVSIFAGRIYLNARPLDRTDALDLACALAHALNTTTVRSPR